MYLRVVGLDDLLNFVIGLGVLAFLMVGMIVHSERPKTPLRSLIAFTAFVIVISGLVPSNP